jgi:beta-mannosidase
MEELEGRSTARAIKRLVQSACDAGFNTLRIWGGGVFESRAFYDAADTVGLMLLHDMMFAGALQPATAPPEVNGGHFPPFGVPDAMSVLDSELRHQVRRLAHHPSIAVWSGCNGDGQCEQFGATNDVMTIVAEEDGGSRPLLPASGDNAGWVSGVDQLTGLPNGRVLVARSSVGHESCGPYEGLGNNGWFSHNTWQPVGINSAPLSLFTPTMLPSVTSSQGRDTSAAVRLCCTEYSGDINAAAITISQRPP